jgi:hypothetical protein
MNTAVNTVTSDENVVTEIGPSLARWYAAHASIRRLWAIEGPVALEILVALEPTSDGNESLPIWLANRRRWATDLQLLIRREIQLRLVVPDDRGEFYVNPDAVTVAELSWRECW